MTEKQLENDILDYLNACGVFCWKNQSVGVYDPSKRVYRKAKGKHHINGVSDIIGVLPDGKALFIEVKKPVKNPRTNERLFNLASDSQQTFIFNAKMNNAIAFVADRIQVVQSHLKEYLS